MIMVICTLTSSIVRVFGLRVLLVITLIIVAIEERATLAADFVVSPTGEKMVIKIEQLKKWKDSRENIQHVLNSTAKTLWRHVPKRRVGGLHVRPTGGPITLTRRGTKGERYVWLDTGDRLWCQYCFQFAHEVGHVLSDNVHPKHRNMWFEESLCEVCSLFALRQLADDWEKNENDKWKRYVPAVREYVQQRKDEVKQPKEFKAWFEGELGSLYGDPVQRMKNLVVARPLLPLFEAEPKHLAAIGYLNRVDVRKIKQFDLFLSNWHTQVPVEHKEFVARVAKEFGVTLPLK